MIRLLEVIESLLGQLKTVEDVRMLIAHADMIREDGLKGVQQERDRADLERRHAAVYRAWQDLEKVEGAATARRAGENVPSVSRSHSSEKGLADPGAAARRV